MFQISIFYSKWGPDPPVHPMISAYATNHKSNAWWPTAPRENNALMKSSEH